MQSAATAWKHVHAEYVDVVDDILATPAPSGPYAYTVAPRVEEGHELPTQRIVTTYEEIENSYRGMHRYAAVVAIRPVAEINTSWYTFVSGVGRGRGREKQTGAESERPVVVIFPTMGSEGITGELFWGRTQRDSMPGDPANGALASRFAVGGLHETLLDAPPSRGSRLPNPWCSPLHPAFRRNRVKRGIARYIGRQYPRSSVPQELHESEMSGHGAADRRRPEGGSRPARRR
ncbi:hypothetical protein ABT063_26855 [Streptomyces sp. NPDC002838]|uniref:hypothetical protein n=1 Tax=Streptomyces sp. NPDC002838 TaxID=3154436 RepID=UPI003325DA48